MRRGWAEMGETGQGVQVLQWRQHAPQAENSCGRAKKKPLIRRSRLLRGMIRFLAAPVFVLGRLVGSFLFRSRVTEIE